MKIEVEWKEIETCPICKAVLVATKNRTECFVFLKEKDGKFRKCFENIALDINPTHWMDIPQMHNAPAQEPGGALSARSPGAQS